MLRMGKSIRHKWVKLSIFSVSHVPVQKTYMLYRSFVHRWSLRSRRLRHRARICGYMCHQSTETLSLHTILELSNNTRITDDKTIDRRLPFVMLLHEPQLSSHESEDSDQDSRMPELV